MVHLSRRCAVAEMESGEVGIYQKGGWGNDEEGKCMTGADTGNVSLNPAVSLI